MNELQKMAHQEGMAHVFGSLDASKPVDMMCVVGWMNEALSKAVDKETLYNVTKRNDEGFVDQHRISNLSRGEMSAYRVAGVLNATQIVLNALISQGFKVTVKAPAAQSEKAV